MEKFKHSNALIHESSPYLLQHAHNPVNWYPWGEEALEKAKKEGKLIIVSIGYSSCHWCHVMEHESFEDETVAKLMNEHFVCIKVDREERPDIDHIYMTAVHLMNQQGGWPLNCIALSDGRPIWGGTYFQKAQWMNILSQIHEYHQTKPAETEKYAIRLAEGISQNSLFQASEEEEALNAEQLAESIKRWSGKFDRTKGGMQGAPKFPMPVSLEFLLQYGVQQKDQEILDFVDTTLSKMARGGIYDQAGGGYARYSVDGIWKVPHFEKMLYDNAQLIGLYAMAYQVFGNENYRRIVDQSINFIEREMSNEDASFYSALDADSEGVEGKFYVWKQPELEELLEGDYELFSEYYNINSTGLWEHGNYILYRTEDPESFATERGIDPKTFLKRIEGWQKLLLDARSQRVRPGLDDKSLTSWNAMMISGLVKSYRASGQKKHLNMAISCATTIRDKMWNADHVLYRNYKDGRISIPGFHIDYALFIAACLDLYETSMDISWLNLAEELTESALEKFYDEASGMFTYNSGDSEVLISHHQEIQDNVIPSSNSVMAHCLFRLGHLQSKREYLDIAARMVKQMSGRIAQYPNGFSGWGSLLLKQLNPFFEIAVVGPDAPDILRQIQEEYLPHALVAASLREQDLPLLKGRYTKDKTHIFVCRDNVCQLPLEDLNDAKAIYHHR
jgi:uncharacterized protein YyaL (SSP411 family)